MSRNDARNRIGRVTTRTGDQGETSLADGRRYRKHDARIDLVGALDEANSALGVLAATVDTTVATELRGLQSRLFDLGAGVAAGAAAVDWPAQTAALERATAALNARLPPLKEFVLPGGGISAAHAHFARTVVRRAERDWWRAAAAKPTLQAIAGGPWLNRLSDYLFVLARTLAESETLWQPLGPATDSAPAE